MKMIRALLLISLSFCALTVFAADPPSEETIEIRAREVGRAIRCVVCQNQSIEDSDAVLAEDMRKLVRSRIRSGDSNEQVIAFMRDRYGDFVLLKPPVQANTYVLWFAPFALLGVFAVWYVVRSRRKVSFDTVPLSAEEKAALKSLGELDDN
jgi:cytochrome c-type biogenesis protein CcmH